MTNKKKRDGWFFNKSIIEEINNVSETAAADVPDELVQQPTPAQAENNPLPEVATEVPKDDENTKVRAQIQLLKEKLADMEEITSELQTNKQALLDAKAEVAQLQEQLSERASELAETKQALDQVQAEKQQLQAQLADLQQQSGQPVEATTLTKEAVAELMASLVHEKQRTLELMTTIEGLQQPNKQPFSE